MRTILFKNGSQEVYKYLDLNGNEVFPEKPKSRIDETINLDFDLDFLKISKGKFTFDKVKKDVQDGKDSLKSVYETMVKDIYDEMKTVFGTSNDVSASAFAATWEAMLKRPANYVDVELGLSDVAAVEAYATAKISASDAYGVFRLKRIAQYQTEKAAIENG